jgi:MFS family permease
MRRARERKHDQMTIMSGLRGGGGGGSQESDRAHTQSVQDAIGGNQDQAQVDKEVPGSVAVSARVEENVSGQHHANAGIIAAVPGSRSESEIGASASQSQATHKESDARARYFQSSRMRAVLLCVLLAIYSHNQCTRNSLVYAVNFACGNSALDQREYINAALGMSASQYAVLASYGFTLMYAILSIIAGRVADIANRPRTLSLAILSWSAALALQASPMSSFTLVFMCRMFQGVAIAFCAPQCISLLTDRFPANRLALATSLYSAGLYLGASSASLTILSNAKFGWRVTFTALAVLGCLLSAVVGLCVSEPREETISMVPAATTTLEDYPKGQTMIDHRSSSPASTAHASMQDLLRAHTLAYSLVLLAQQTCIRTGEAARTLVTKLQEICRCQGMGYVLSAAAVRFCAGYAIGVWASPYFRARFPAEQHMFAFVNAFAVGVGGCMSTFLGGALTHLLTPRNKAAPLHVPVAGFLMAIPLWIAAVFWGEFYGAMAFYVLTLLASECWIGPAMYALSVGVPKEVCVCFFVAHQFAAPFSLSLSLSLSASLSLSLHACLSVCLSVCLSTRVLMCVYACINVPRLGNA